MYYSQHGEDFILDKIYKSKQNGVYVEIGCIDGRRFSNSLLFELKGWDGVNIEAHPDYIDFLKQNRPNSKVVHAAVSSHDGGGIDFYADRRGALSSLDKGREKELRRDYADYFSGYKKISVPCRTISSVLNQYGVSEIDFLSIDIEGTELDALKGIDFNQHRPTVLISEFDSISKLNALKKYLSKFGYEEAIILKNNLFMTTDLTLFYDVQNRKFRAVDLRHTGNPVDNDPDVEVQVVVDTTKSVYYRNLLAFAEKKIRHIVKDILRKYD